MPVYKLVNVLTVVSEIFFTHKLLIPFKSEMNIKVLSLLIEIG